MNGLRTIDLSFSSATVGTSVDLHLQLTFAGVCTDGDTIVITVPDGFTAPSSSIASLTCMFLASLTRFYLRTMRMFVA